MFWFIVGAALVALAAAAVISAETIIEYLKERKKVLNKNLKLGIISDKLREGDYNKVNVGLYDVDDKYIETVSITGDEISDEIYVGMVLEVWDQKENITLMKKR